MNISVSYPIPTDNWETFEPDVIRFARSLHQFAPGREADVTFRSCVDKGGYYNSMRQGFLLGLFDGFKIITERYDGGGCDIGAHLHIADMAGDDFLICLSTRVYAYRAGWIEALAHAREELGPGLYGTAISFENNPHIRTHCFGIDARMLREYPHRVNNRERGYFFESGVGNPEGSFYNWCCGHFIPCRIVHWDGVYEFEPAAQVHNRFRHGDQSNLLVFDRHTKLWEDSEPEERNRLTDLTYGHA